MKTYAYGFPRLGKDREYKKALEAFWKNDISQAQAQQSLEAIAAEMAKTYAAHVDIFPVGEMTAYDNMLDTAIITGVFKPKDLKAYYELCRGKNALEMTKWFNTNYHYLVTDFSALKKYAFSVHWNKPLEALGRVKGGLPALLGPFTFLKLSKGLSAAKFEENLMKLAGVYKKILKDLPQVHLEEPAFCMDLTAKEVSLIKKAYKLLAVKTCVIHLVTYYGAVDFLKDLYDLPVAALGLDFVHGAANLDLIKKHGFPADKILIAGLVDGRNVWRNDIAKSVATLKTLQQHIKTLWVSNAAPLYHLPITLKGEQLEPQLMSRLAFAEEKLAEIKAIADAFEGGRIPQAAGANGLGKNLQVQSRVAALTNQDFQKTLSVAKRRALQKKNLNLPLFPTTTIGSFPQTSEVRKMRADFRSGKISKDQYQNFVRGKIEELVAYQEKLGLDVLVHGEFERTDMVEFFAEKLDGIATTENGWIISYGSRGYRPPIIFGDVTRPRPMTVDEITYAQSLTSKPVKGMLTGPVTIIAWSFVREDIPIGQVAYQLGLALQDEIRDYEKVGIKVVQIDEPAIREKAPIKRRDWPKYFDWAIKSFRLAANTAPETQIHTHMCYSEFGEIVKEIDKMDFDVISIETTRSRGDIIRSFEKIDFKKQIGLGVWDIHSPAVPSPEDMRKVVQRALRVIPKENFWINPDCGLKTRNWEETTQSLENLVLLASKLRKQ